MKTEKKTKPAPTERNEWLRIQMAELLKEYTKDEIIKALSFIY